MSASTVMWRVALRDFEAQNHPPAHTHTPARPHKHNHTNPTTHTLPGRVKLNMCWYRTVQPSSCSPTLAPLPCFSSSSYSSSFSSFSPPLRLFLCSFLQAGRGKRLRSRGSNWRGEHAARGGDAAAVRCSRRRASCPGGTAAGRAAGAGGAARGGSAGCAYGAANGRGGECDVCMFVRVRKRACMRVCGHT
jgi:hypothetical protein